jgi:hypothetical protein
MSSRIFTFLADWLRITPLPTPLGVRLTGVCLIDMHLTDIHFIAVYIVGVHLAGMHLIGVKVEVKSGQL